MKKATAIYYRSNDKKAQVQSLRLFFMYVSAFLQVRLKISTT